MGKTHRGSKGNAQNKKLKFDLRNQLRDAARAAAAEVEAMPAGGAAEQLEVEEEEAAREVGGRVADESDGVRFGGAEAALGSPPAATVPAARAAGAGATSSSRAPFSSRCSSSLDFSTSRRTVRRSIAVQYCAAG